MWRADRGAVDLAEDVVRGCGQFAAMRLSAVVPTFYDGRIKLAREAATTLRAAGLSCPVVSVGSTPTAHFATALDGVTEVRAGVYVFFDLVMAGVNQSFRFGSLALLARLLARRLRPAKRLGERAERGRETLRHKRGFGVVRVGDGVDVGEPGGCPQRRHERGGVLRTVQHGDEHCGFLGCEWDTQLFEVVGFGHPHRFMVGGADSGVDVDRESCGCCPDTERHILAEQHLW